VYSYGHLLKAYCQEQDVASAAAAFQEMQAAGIESNLIVYTTLIQTCITRKEFDTAWQIFNLIKLKSTATAPDASTYALMIHACAHAGETERALDLHTDMTERKGIPPTTETYHSLLHACAMRKDYFNEAWRIATEMQRNGFEIGRITLNVLIQACGKVGELVRARLLVRHMMASGMEDLVPDKWTYQNLLRAYATYHAPSNCRGKFRNKTDQKTIDLDKAAFVQPETVLRKRGHDSAPEEIPFLPKSVLQNAREVVDEAALVVNWLRDTHPELVDTQILNAFLDICLAQSSFSDLKWSYENDLENPTGPLSPLPPPPPRSTCQNSLATSIATEPPSQPPSSFATSPSRGRCGRTDWPS
jgi:pentatricopeptide repeat protein